jgi:hypothetical protein
VRSIYEELVARKVDLTSPIALLSDQTSWQMSVLLEDCLLFPKILPYVREKDEVRRYLRCHLCRQRERPIDAKLFWFCDVCMQRALDAVQTRKPAKGLIFFRTYNSECRCRHSDSDTVLVTDETYGGLNGACEQCLVDEIGRRKRTA